MGSHRVGHDWNDLAAAAAENTEHSETDMGKGWVREIKLYKKKKKSNNAEKCKPKNEYKDK